MELLYVRFPTSGVETWVFLPPLVMFVVSFLTSMGGVSGAFVLLPFQMSVLGYTDPGVTATNFVYNVVAIPLGVYRRLRDGLLCWPLFLVLSIGTLPGLFVGYYLRIVVLPDPAHFRPFVGLVLAALALSMARSLRRETTAAKATPLEPNAGRPRVRGHVGFSQTRIELGDEAWRLPTLPTVGVAGIVGVVGAAYGIGGGALLAPFCISVLRLPPGLVAGATLLSTWLSSVLAALCYAFVPIPGAVNAPPDWLLGGLFGLGGMAGIYLGARAQRHVPARFVKGVLAVAISMVALRYLAGPIMAWLGG